MISDQQYRMLGYIYRELVVDVDTSLRMEHYFRLLADLLEVPWFIMELTLLNLRKDDAVDLPF
jgi:hypothetical protein